MSNLESAVKGFWHAGVTVRSMERSLAFYRDVMGLAPVDDTLISDDYIFDLVNLKATAIRIVLLQVPGSDANVELIEYQGLERHGADARPCDYGCGHFCLYVDDVYRLHERLRAAGFEPRTGTPVAITAGPKQGALALYAVDPDGYIVELFQLPVAAG